MSGSGMRVKRDDIGPALKGLTAGLKSAANVLAVGNVARAVIANRTQNEKLNLDRQPFEPYGTGRYYASIDNRPPGYPKPSGGRTKALRGGRELKTVAYDSGYGQYKSGIGRGSTPQLSVSGAMLSDIQVRVVSPSRVMLFFGSRLAAAKASGHHFGKRPFFGIHEVERANLYGALSRQIAAIKGMHP